MASFSRYYKDRKLYDFSMSDIESLIVDETNKKQLADIIFHRYYDRYLKPFYFSSPTQQTYTETVNENEVKSLKNEFTTEFKSGFVIMTNCCLLIEVIATYFEGANETTKSGSETFKAVFKKANEYSNELKIFENEHFYRNIRCGLLHQGETYGKFKIRRSGALLNKEHLTINAKLFCDKLKDFLNSYRQELMTAKWDSDIWDKCRIKLMHIINNSK